MQAGANFYYFFMQQWCNIINPHAQKAIFHHPIIVLPDSANIAHNYFLWNIMDIFLAVQQSLEGQVLFCLLVMTAAHDFTLAPYHNVVYVCSYSERVRTCQCLRMRFVGINTYVRGVLRTMVSQACLEQRSVWWWQTLVDGLPVCQE